MQQNEAVDLLNRTTFRPGWTIKAQAVPYTDTGVYLTLSLDTVDTSYPDYLGNYDRPVSRPLSYDSVIHANHHRTREDLLYYVLRMVSFIQEHEDREFLRVREGGQWVAPFHPHRPEGDAAWAAAGGTSEAASARQLLVAA